MANGAEHERLVQTVHERTVHIATTLPNHGGLTGAALKAAVEKDAPRAGVVEMSRLVQWLLPGPVTDVAYFRHRFVWGQDHPHLCSTNPLTMFDKPFKLLYLSET